MKSSEIQIILGSRSAQRFAVLSQLVSPEQIRICPPRSSEELDFRDRNTWGEIQDRLQEIASEKLRDVHEQLREKPNFPELTSTFILTADTVIVADDNGCPLVLGKPPDPDWRDTVKFWFENYLLGKTHRAVTAVCLENLRGEHRHRVVVSEVTFLENSPELLEWYLKTAEPRGKAGGYGIQAAGSVFVSELKGSFSNVVGLPQRAVWEMLSELGVGW